jgi:protein SCO1/2
MGASKLKMFMLLTVITVLCSTIDNSFAIGGAGPLDQEQLKGTKNERPAFMDEVGIDENLGTQLDLDLDFTDEEGASVKLGKYFTDKPVFLMLIYYKCPTLCNTHLNTLMQTFKDLEWKIGKDYEFVAISIDPAESNQVAKMKKRAYLDQYGDQSAGSGWHFLTGKQASIDKITKQIGFRYAWNKEEQEWAHAAAAYISTPKGKLSYYHYGLNIVPKVLRLSLVEASEGKIGSVMDRVLLFCLQYDPNKKTYAFYAYNLMQVGAALIVLVLLIFFFTVWRKEKRRKHT